METIDNMVLERELKDNHSMHELFEYQRNSTLDGVVKTLKESNGNDILLQISINNVIPFYKFRASFLYESEEESRYWNHIISILFMSQLKEKYDLETSHEIEEEKKVMTRESFETYQLFESTLVDRNDVIEAIRKLGLENPRLHIVVSSFNNEFVWKELVNYFQDGLPFITMIYTDGNMASQKVSGTTEVFKYKRFVGSEEGFASQKLLLDKQYKKALKNEAKIQEDLRRNNEQV